MKVSSPPQKTTFSINVASISVLKQHLVEVSFLCKNNIQWNCIRCMVRFFCFDIWLMFLRFVVVEAPVTVSLQQDQWGSAECSQISAKEVDLHSGEYKTYWEEGISLRGQKIRISYFVSCWLIGLFADLRYQLQMLLFGKWSETGFPWRKIPVKIFFVKWFLNGSTKCSHGIYRYSGSGGQGESIGRDDSSVHQSAADDDGRSRELSSGPTWTTTISAASSHLRNRPVIAIKAPPETRLEVPDPNQVRH